MRNCTLVLGMPRTLVLGMPRQKILNPWLVLQSKHSFKPFDYTVYLDSKFRHCDYTSYATHLWGLSVLRFVALWCLSHYDACHLWRLSHYDVCHQLWHLSPYDVSQFILGSEKRKILFNKKSISWDYMYYSNTCLINISKNDLLTVHVCGLV